MNFDHHAVGLFVAFAAAAAFSISLWFVAVRVIHWYFTGA